MAKIAQTLSERLKESARGEHVLPFDPIAVEEQRLAILRIDDIETDPLQPRQDLGDLKELTDSVAEKGVLIPIIVQPVSRGRYRIIAGERRFSAAKAAKRTEIPAIVRTIEDHDRIELQLLENLHRKDLNPMEEALGYRRLMDEFNVSQREVSRRLGKSPSSINETLRLLELPQAIIDDVRTSEHLTKSVLLEIVRQPDPELQLKMWKRARLGELTVRQARSEPQTSKSKPSASSQESRYTVKQGPLTLTVKWSETSLPPEQRLALLQAAYELACSTEKGKKF